MSDKIFISALSLVVIAVLSVTIISIISNGNEEDSNEYGFNIKTERKTSKKNSSDKIFQKNISEKAKSKKHVKEEKYINTDDFSKFVKGIRLKPILDSGKFIGVKVIKIKIGSLFYKIGLREKDLILSFNEKRIDNMTKTLSLCKSIANSESFKFLIKRNNKEKVLYYNNS